MSWDLEQTKAWFAFVRGVILLGVGLFFGYNEIVVAEEADKEVLALVAGMIGLEWILRA